MTDAKGALDNAVRVLQAMIDVSSDAGWLGVTLRLMNLQQQLMQGRRVEDPSLATLPGVSLELARLAVRLRATVYSYLSLIHMARNTDTLFYSSQAPIS